MSAMSWKREGAGYGRVELEVRVWGVGVVRVGRWKERTRGREGWEEVL